MDKVIKFRKDRKLNKKKIYIIKNKKGKEVKINVINYE